MVVKAKIANREWYQAYCAAMLETDMDKVFASVESARRAIQTRAKELGVGLANSNHESKELDRALRFLTMLVNCAAPAKVPGLRQLTFLLQLNHYQTFCRNVQGHLSVFNRNSFWSCIYIHSAQLCKFCLAGITR